MAAYDFTSGELALLWRSVVAYRAIASASTNVEQLAALTHLRSKLAIYAGERFDAEPAPPIADELEPPAHVRAYREGRRLADELRCRYCGALATSVQDAVSHAFSRHRGELLEEFGLKARP